MGNKRTQYDFKLAGEKRLFDISSLDEWRTQTYENGKLFKEKVKRWHDKKIQKREFKVGEYVLLYNSRFRFFARKLLSKWEGPCVIKEVYRSGAIKINNAEGTNPKVVNGQRIKHYISGTPINVERNIIQTMTLEEHIKETFGTFQNHEKEEVRDTVSKRTPKICKIIFCQFWNITKIRKIRNNPEGTCGGHKTTWRAWLARRTQVGCAHLGYLPDSIFLPFACFPR